MIIYITRFCTFAVQVPGDDEKVPRAVRVIQVVPETDEHSWKLLRTFSVENVETAIEFADGLEEAMEYLEVPEAVKKMDKEFGRDL